MANPHSSCTQAQTEQQQQQKPPSIQVPPPPHPPPEEDQSPRSTSSNPSPRPLLRSPGGGTTTKKHPVYRGIRSRSGKWVSEIREPRKTTRIWLGTYPTPDMAAAAYDAAALALKGPDTPLNFQNYRESYPIPKSNSATDIRAVAASAAASRRVEMMRIGSNQDPNPDQNQVVDRTTSSCSSSSLNNNNNKDKEDIVDVSGQEFIDEEAILNMPNLLVHMAGGMLVSPPRINTPSSDDSPENSDVEGLWSY